jgi:hypothetical protein
MSIQFVPYDKFRLKVSLSSQQQVFQAMWLVFRHVYLPYPAFARLREYSKSCPSKTRLPLFPWRNSFLRYVRIYSIFSPFALPIRMSFSLPHLLAYHIIGKTAIN